MCLRIKHSLLALVLGVAMVTAALALASTASSSVEAGQPSSGLHFVDDVGQLTSGTAHESSSALPGTLSQGVEAAQPIAGLRFVDDQGKPISGTVRVLCYATPVAGAPWTDLTLRTDTYGEPKNSLPPGCNYVAALHLKHTQPGKPGHGPAYWVYATSWPPGTTVPLTATGNMTAWPPGTTAPLPIAITISNDWPLVLFNAVASLAWEPAPNSDFVADLRESLFLASEYLYDLTDGRMAFGPVAIHTGGHNWNRADLRFLAANALPPWAYVGGMASQRISYTPTVTPTVTSTVYAPGAVFLGRYWDGTSALGVPTSTWTYTKAYRTIVHEWAHYALFLYDEYQGPSGKRHYCICDDLHRVGATSISTTCDGMTSTLAASAMAYHYTATEFWHLGAHNNLTACKNTRQWEVHQESDWETLEKWYTIQGLSGLPSPTSTLVPGPEPGLAGDLFGRMPGYRIYLPAVYRSGFATRAIAATRIVSEPTIFVSLSGKTAVSETLPTQVYILEGGASSPTRILYQGQIISDPIQSAGYFGHIELLGVEPHAHDRARIFVDRYSTTVSSGSYTTYNPGGRFVYPSVTVSDSTLYNGFVATATVESWKASLDIGQELRDGKFTTMTVALTSSPPLTTAPTAQLCVPDAAIGCHSHWKDVMITDGNTWTATFIPLSGTLELPLYGTVRVTVPRVGEIIRWFEVLGGVGPAHDRGDAPTADGLLMVDTGHILSEPHECNRVFVSPAASAEALSAPLQVLTDGQDLIGGVLGLPLDIDILLPTDDTCVGTGSGDHTLPVSVTLTLFYAQDMIDQLARTISETTVSETPAFSETIHLRILHFDRGANAWVEQSTLGSDENLNWLSTKVGRDGIYAIAWIMPSSTRPQSSRRQFVP